MEWSDFANHVYHELGKGNALFNFHQPFQKEQELTRQLGIGLRKLFAESYGLPVTYDALSYHVIFRDGDTQKDKDAWKKSKSDKWIPFHGVRFVPDFLIRRNINDPNDILPIEVKLIKNAGSGQGIATAIGQSLIYCSRYPQSIIFIGITKPSRKRKYSLSLQRDHSENIIYERLHENGVRMILREVGQ